jgi:oxygen-independent coproporphyrinogen-3 oxidase
MCQERIDFAAVDAEFGSDFCVYFAPELAHLRALAADGLVTLAPQTIEITPRGRMLTRNVAMVFDAYLQQRVGEPLYSRVI